MNLYYCENTYDPIVLTKNIWFSCHLVPVLTVSYFGNLSVFLHIVNRTCNSFRGQIWADSLNPIIDAMMFRNKRYTMMLYGAQVSPLALQAK